VASRGRCCEVTGTCEKVQVTIRRFYLLKGTYTKIRILWCRYWLPSAIATRVVAENWLKRHCSGFRGP